MTILFIIGLIITLCCFGFTSIFDFFAHIFSFEFIIAYIILGSIASFFKNK